MAKSVILKFWDNDTNEWNSVSENGGLPVFLAGVSAKEPFSGSANVTHTFTQEMNGFVISNDGTSDLTFTIGTDTFTVKGGEVFEEYFEPFTNVTVTTTVAFRAYGRG